MTTDQPIYLTPEGLTKIKNSHEELTTNKRRQIAERIRLAKELGDLSENAEYADAKDEQAFVEGKILELEHILKNAEVMAQPQSGGRIQIGSTVDVDSDSGSQVFTIVGHNEADPSKGLISHESPLGKAFMGRKEGENIHVTVPKGTRELKIVKVR